MVRALAVLTCGAFLTLVIGVVGAGKPVLTVVLGGLYTVLATVGFALGAPPRPAGVVGGLRRGGARAGRSGVRPRPRRRGDVVAGRAGQPVRAAAAAAGPSWWSCSCRSSTSGMAWRDGLREGSACSRRRCSRPCVTELLRREQQTRGELVAAHEQLRDYALQAERLATAQERNRVARDIHDGLGHALTVVQMQIKAARAVLPPSSAGRRGAGQGAGPGRGGAGRGAPLGGRAARARACDPPLPEALKALAEETSAAGVPTAARRCPAPPGRCRTTRGRRCSGRRRRG